METAVLVATFGLAGLVVALYLWFISVRYRAEKRRKTATAPASAPASGPGTTRLAPSPAPGGAPTGSPVTAAPVLPIPPSVTVAGLLAGVRLPCDLVPLTNVEPRTDVADRVAFATTAAPAEVVRREFEGELERLGFTVVPLGQDRIAAERDGAQAVLQVAIHQFAAGVTSVGRAAFPTAPEGGVVVEAWVSL